MTNDLKARTKRFAVEVFAFCAKLPLRFEIDHLRRQLLRASSSVAANYRAACRGRSKADFVAKLGIVEEEADEAQFWLELLPDAMAAIGEPLKPTLRPELQRLSAEADQLIRIVVASKKTARANLQSSAAGAAIQNVRGS